MLERDLQPVYDECHEIAGDGVVPECKESIVSGECRANCFCVFGTYLFPGEKLREIPDGVDLIGGAVKNCVNPDGCKFAPGNKPLICKLAPEVMTLIGWTGSARALETGSLPVHMQDVCPILNNISEDRKKIVTKVLSVLETNGIWRPGYGVMFPRITVGDLWRAIKITVSRWRE
jgi:hypothetical protein